MDADKHLTARAGPQQLSGPCDLGSPGIAGHSVLPQEQELMGSHFWAHSLHLSVLVILGAGDAHLPTRREQQSGLPGGAVVQGPRGEGGADPCGGTEWLHALQGDGGPWGSPGPAQRGPHSKRPEVSASGSVPPTPDL